MYSFYGGRPGNSFIIITTFGSIADMVAEFSKGPAYTDVHYDEHILINTTNKNDPDNGKIFRRGYNYTDELGGAEYIGQIVGPSGPAPNLSLTEYDTIEEQKAKHDPKTVAERIKYSKGSLSLIDNDLIPGYDKDKNEYNDKIQWNSYSIRTEGSEICNAYIGFKIPYLVIDLLSEKVDAHSDPDVVEHTDSQGHPFYKKWILKIPEGIKGTSLSNLKIKKYDENEDRDLITTDGQAYVGTEGKHIMIYDQTSYDNPVPTVIQKYLGDYNIIQDISHENGKLLIKCTNDDIPQEFPINEIESINLNSKTGQFSIKYYNKETPITFSLKWVKDVDFDETKGTLTFKYANSETQEKVCPINWIKGAETKKVSPNDDREFLYLNWVNPIDGDSKETPLSDFRWIKNLILTKKGQLQVTYNDNTSKILNPNNHINWVESIGVNKNGGLHCILNDGNTYNITMENSLKWITSTQISDTGVLTINYNAGSPQTLEEHPIRWIKSIDLSADGTLTIVYNTGETQEMVNKIRWVQDMTMNDDTGDVTVEYNDNTTSVLGTLRSIDSVSINEDNHLMILYSDSEEAVDAGSVAANLIFDQPVYGLNWSGIGQIVVSIEEEEGIGTQTVKYLNFTTSATSLIADKTINLLGCDNLITTLRTNQAQISFGENYLSLISVEKNLIGLNFMIRIPETENSAIYEDLTEGALVDVFISGVDLQFIGQ